MTYTMYSCPHRIGVYATLDDCVECRLARVQAENQRLRGVVRERNILRTIVGQLRASRQYDLTPEQWEKAIDDATRTVDAAAHVDS